MMHSLYFFRLNHQKLGKLGKLEKKFGLIHHIRNNITEFINSLLQYRDRFKHNKVGYSDSYIWPAKLHKMTGISLH